MPKNIHQPLKSLTTLATAATAAATKTKNASSTGWINYPPPKQSAVQTSSLALKTNQTLCTNLLTSSNGGDYSSSIEGPQSLNLQKRGIIVPPSQGCDSVSSGINAVRKKKRYDRKGDLMQIMNNFDNKMRCQLDQLENSMHLVHVK